MVTGCKSQQLMWCKKFLQCIGVVLSWHLNKCEVLAFNACLFCMLEDSNILCCPCNVLLLTFDFKCKNGDLQRWKWWCQLHPGGSLVFSSYLWAILGRGTTAQDLLLFLLNIICFSFTINHKLTAITSTLWITTHQLWPWLTAINKGLSHEWIAVWTDFSFSGFPCHSHCSKFCHWFHSFLVHVHTVNSPGEKNTSFISMRPLCWCIMGAARG